MITNRILLPGEAELLRDMLVSLADYHSSVAENRDVRYPAHDIDETITATDEGIKTGKYTMNACFEGGNPVAFCSLEINKKENRGELKYLFVSDSHRKHGLGDFLMEWALREFDKSEIGLIDIRVVLGNSALAFYERYGFKPGITVISRKG